jgi:hypothetical protein
VREDEPLICEIVDREERSSPCTRDIMTGLSARVDGTVHFIGTTTPSVVYLLVVTVSPAFGSVTSNASSFWAYVPTRHNDRKERVTKRDMVTAWIVTICVGDRK